MLCKMRLRQISITEKLFKRATLNSTRFASVIHLGKPFCPWTLEKELLKLENRSIRYTIFDWSNCQSNYQLLEIKYTNVGKIVIEATIYNPNIEDCNTFGFSNKLLLSFEFVINSKSETCNKNTGAVTSTSKQKHVAPKIIIWKLEFCLKEWLKLDQIYVKLALKLSSTESLTVLEVS